MTTSDVRTAHKLLDRVSQGRAVLEEEISLLRSFLPELPAQKTLEEIAWDVHFAWCETSGNDWKEELFGDLETWLSEQHEQLRAHLEGVKSQAHPALPAGMRLADHAAYGRVVTSPKPDQDGVYVLLIPKPKVETGADWEYAHECELTFVDNEPAHPEFLETEADYAAAPEGTIVACDDSPPCHKFGSEWSSVLFCGMKDNRGMSRAIRQVLRWGNE